MHDSSFILSIVNLIHLAVLWVPDHLKSLSHHFFDRIHDQGVNIILKVVNENYDDDADEGRSGN